MKALSSFLSPLLPALLFLNFLTPNGVFAAQPLDGFYEIETTGILIPYFTIENGEIVDASGALFNPVCTDNDVSPPALATDLMAFFENVEGTRIINRGDGHYLMSSNIVFDSEGNLQGLSGGTLVAVYLDIRFNSSTSAIFTHKAATAFFSGEGLGTSTCIGTDTYNVNRVN